MVTFMRNYYLEERTNDLELDNTRLKATVAELTEQVAMMSYKASDVTHKASASTGKSDTYTQFTSFACASNFSTLSCPNSQHNLCDVSVLLVDDQSSL